MGPVLLIGGIKSLLTARKEAYNKESLGVNLAAGLMMILIGGGLTWLLVLRFVRLFKFF